MTALNLTYKQKIQQPNSLAKQIAVNSLVKSIGDKLAKHVEANVISYEELLKIHNLATDTSRLKNALRWL